MGEIAYNLNSVRTEKECVGINSLLIQGYRHVSFAPLFLPSEEVTALSGLLAEIWMLLILDKMSQVSKEYSLKCLKLICLRLTEIHP